MRTIAIGCAITVWGVAWGGPTMLVGPIPPTPSNLYAPPAQVHTVSIPGNYVTPTAIPNPTMAVDVDGFLELKFMRRNQSPQTATGTRLSTIRNSYAYQQLPPDVVANTSFRNNNRYDLSLTGQYGDALSIRFQASKEPDFDMITNILLKYNEFSVFLGDFSAALTNGPFLNLNRSLNGLSVQGSAGTQWWGQWVMGREKSKPKRVTFYGNGGTSYSLPNQNLLDGSVKILVNNQETSAYVVNYTTGTIVFDSPKTDAQFIKVMYEFTNPIADFLPAARSRKSFMGGEFEWKPKRAGWQEPVVHSAQAMYPAEADLSLEHANVVVGSETVFLAPANGGAVALERIVDYDLDYRDGRLRLKYPVISTQNQIRIAYKYYDVQSQTETIVANDSKGPVYLASQHIVPHSVSIWLNNRVLMEHYDYTVSYYTGQVYFAYPIRHPDTITIQYETIRQHTRYGDANETENGFRIKASYMNEFVRADDAQFPSVTETVVASQNQLVLSHNPIDLNTVVVTDANDNEVTIDTGNSSAYSGIVRLASLTDGTYSVTYQYRSSQQMIGILRLNQASGQTVVFASDVLGDALSLPALPVNYNSIQRVVVNPGTPSMIELNQHAYAVNYLNEGNKIDIQFFRNSDSDAHQQSNLTEILPMGTVVYLYYQTPTNLESGAMLDNKTYGFSAGYNWGDRGELDVTVALAENNFQRKEIEAEEADIQPDLSGRYHLMHTNIVEGSEVIRIKKPGTQGILLNRNADYSINYIQGSFQFQTMTVSTADVVDIRYRYYEVGDGSRKIQKSGAYRVQGGYQLADRLNVSGHTTVIDKAFKPVGTIAEASGTTVWGGRMDYAPGPNQTLFSQIETRRVYQPYSNDDSVYNNNQQVIVGSDQWTWRGIQTQFQYEHQRTTQRQPASTNYKINEEMNRYQAQIGFGPKHLKTIMNTQQSAKLDAAQDQSSYSDQYDIKTVYNQSNVLWMDDIHITASYARSHSKQESNRFNTSREVNTKQFLSELNPNSAMRIQLDSSIDSIQTRNGQDTYLESIPDVTGKLMYTPYYWLKTNVQYRDKVNESAVFGQYGNQETRQVYQIDRWELYPMLVALNRPWVTQQFQFLRRSNLMTSYTVFNQKQNNRLMHTRHDTVSVTYRDFSPVSFMTIQQVSAQNLIANTDNRVQTGDQTQALSTSRTTDWSGHVRFKHNQAFWRHWEYAYTFNNQRVNAKTQTHYTNNTNANTASYRDSRDITHRVSFNPGSVHVLGVPMGPVGTTIRHSDSMSQYNAQTVDRDAAVTSVIDQSDAEESQVQLNLAPYNRVQTRVEWGEKTQFFSRSMTTQKRGTFLNIDQDVLLNLSMPIINRLNLTAQGTWYAIAQYSKPDETLSRSAVQSPRVYQEKLAQYADSYSADLDWRLRSWLSLTVGANRLFKQEATHRPADTVPQKHLNFHQIVGRTGFVWRPWSFMDVDYDYSHKTAETSQSSGAKTGKSHTVKIKLHNKKPRISVDMTMDWAYTTGQDFNTLDQNALRSGAGIVTNIAIRNREDYVRNMSVNVDINVPTNVQFVDKITVTGSGYFSSVVDQINETNSYDVGGVMITTRVDF